VTVALLGLAVARRLGPESRAPWLARAEPRPLRWWHERLLRVARGELAARDIAPYVAANLRCELLLAEGLDAERRGDVAAAAALYAEADGVARPAQLTCALATTLGRTLAIEPTP
jgi:hypothetical protein